MTSLKVVTATIPAGQSLSNGADCTGSTRLIRIIVPPSWGTVSMTFQLSSDNSIYRNLYNVTIPGAAYNTFEAVVSNPVPGSALTLPNNLGMDVAWMKIRSGTSIIPILQHSDQVFGLVLEMP